MDNLTSRIRRGGSGRRVYCEPPVSKSGEVTPTDGNRSDSTSKLVGSTMGSASNNEDGKQPVAFTDITEYVDLSIADLTALEAGRRPLRCSVAQGPVVASRSDALNSVEVSFDKELPLSEVQSGNAHSALVVHMVTTLSQSLEDVRRVAANIEKWRIRIHAPLLLPLDGWNTRRRPRSTTLYPLKVISVIRCLRDMPCW